MPEVQSVSNKERIINHEDGQNIIAALQSIKNSYGRVFKKPTMASSIVPYTEGVTANVLDYIDGFDSSSMIVYGDITASEKGSYTCYIALKRKNDVWSDGSIGAIKFRWVLIASDVSWPTATDETLVTLIQLADAGMIDLSEDCGWEVGDERTVSLSAMSATGVGENHSAQNVVFVILHKGLYKDVNNKTVNFIVGLKDCLATSGYMNSSNTYSSSWDGCARRTWCNGTFYNSLPSVFKSLFKQFKTVTARTYNSSDNTTSVDYFALPAVKEIMGGNEASSASGSTTFWSNLTEFNALTQFDYYKTSANRIKSEGINGYADASWMTRSPQYNYNYQIVVMTSGNASNGYANSSYYIAPFGCI